METLPTASAVFDRQMRYLAFNTRWRQAYRLGDADLIGRSHYEVFPEVSQDWRAVHRRCLGGATERREGDPFPRVDGSVDYIDWVVAPWRDEEGAIGGIVMHTHVVTERHITERRLGEEQAFVRELFEKSPVGMNLCRLDGLCLESNPAFLNIIGYSREEVEGGLTYWQLTPRDYDEAEQEQLRSLETSGRYGPYEKEFIRKDGSRVPVRLTGFLIEREGEKFIWTLIEDMTAQRALEANLYRERLKTIQAAKLASIGELAAGIAHEINNPLQIIDGYAFELEGALESAEPSAREALSSIRKATDRAARIVRGLRTFAREEEGERGDHPAAQIAEESLALTAARMWSHGVSVVVDVRTERTVCCNLVELTQVLVNLLSNAFDAVKHRRGTVRLLVDDAGDDEVTFVVEDSGPGVEPALRERIFEPFVTTKASGEGTGLGLSISRGIVESTGGSLAYEPLETGSRFIVRLPAGGAE